MPLTLFSPFLVLCFLLALRRDPNPDLSFSKLALGRPPLFIVAKMLICSSPLDPSSDIYGAKSGSMILSSWKAGNFAFFATSSVTPR
jgi:hypothetical protein